ncbi:MAG: type II toxin-antitoxin system RelE/ParE family toxin [Armatimonadota bacterium]|nr:type II toxin-antitoxin system RelE/ParE family toxin [Armatimonadota bacterium]
MAKITVVFYRDADGSVPVLEWLDREVGRRDRRIAAKCRAAIKALQQDGRDLRRPTADYLRDGIYELRVHFGTVNYRMLYFFHGESIAIVSHGLMKEKEVPDKEITLAMRRKVTYESDPERHSYEETKED